MSSQNNTLKCSECKSVFSEKKNFNAHLRKFHDNIECVIRNTKPKLECATCSKLFSNQYTLNRHLKNFHININGNDHNYSKSMCSNTCRLLCPRENCTGKFPNYSGLEVHLKNEHSVDIEIENLEFNSVEDFEKWKDRVQQESLSFYTLDTAPKQLSAKLKRQYFNCHRSFMYNPKGKNVRSLKSMGSKKIGRACPSRMVVTFIDTASSNNKTNLMIKVLFYKTHCGHAFQLGHLVLDKQSRAEIAGKLKEGVSFNHILDSIRDNDSDQIGANQRISLIERKDLYNIVRDYNIDYSTKRHENDALSVTLWVKEMQALNEDCPVLYYKGQDEDDPDTGLEKSDFVLIIMTKFQSRQLNKFGANKICIDGTHGTNSYDIQLYTVMTVDEFGTGCPVAYCFSNRSDEYIFSIYFSKLKKKIGIIKANVFMSDDAPAFYNAWACVMGDVKNKLLCTWHVDRNWRQNLNKIGGGSDKKSLVYKTLRVLMQMTSVNEFRVCLNSTLKQLSEDDDTKNFGEYFQRNYVYRPESWAYCYRLGLGINTNMYLESFHKVLKHIYLEGRKIKRLDKTISAVIKIARDSLFKRLIKLTKNTPTEKNYRITISHKISHSISPDMISMVQDKEWLVCSSNNPLKKYHVSYIQKSCSEMCLKCNICDVCIHSFKCSCTDNLIKLNICKHIHACAQHYLGCNNDSSQMNVVGSNNASEVSDLLDLCQSNITCSKVNTNEKIIKKAELIIGLSNNVSLSKESCIEMEKYLDKVINLLNKSDTISLKTTEHVNVQEKIEKQQRLYSTKKRKKGKSYGFEKPSFSETNIIKDGLSNQSSEVLNIHSGFDHSYVKE